MKDKVCLLAIKSRFAELRKSESCGGKKVMNLKQLLQGKIRVNNKFPFVNTRDTACIICNHIVNWKSPILFVSHDEDDGMWQFLCGGSHGVEDAKVVALGEVFDLDPSIEKVAEMPCGYCATRDKIDDD